MGLQLLSVINDETVLGNVRSVLESPDFTLLTPVSVKKAIQLLDQNSDIDVVMLGPLGTCESSAPIARHIRNLDRVCAVPMIVVGSHLYVDEVKQCLEFDVNDIAVTPLHQETFRAKVIKLSEEGRPTVLVVDDEPIILELIENLLVSERFRVLTATSADEGIELLKSNQVHVVVSDLKMPGKSGFDLLVEVKEKYPTVPVILISGHAGKFAPQDVLAAGADGFFALPFHNTDVVYTLRRVLGPRYQKRRSKLYDLSRLNAVLED